MPLYATRRLTASWGCSWAVSTGLSVLTSVAIALQVALYVVTEQWFDSICTHDESACPEDDIQSPLERGEFSRPKVRLENIGNIVQIVFCSLALLVIIRRPTEAQLPFILVMILSRPILFLVQAIRTIELQNHLPAFGSFLLIRRLHLEIAQLAVWILFLVGFTLYTCVSRKTCWTPGTVWKPLTFSLSFFAIEIATRSNQTIRYLSISFMVLTVIVAIVTGVARWYYCRQAAHELSSVSPYRTSSFDKPTDIIEAPHSSATCLSHHHLSVVSVDESSCIKDSSITSTDRVSKLDLVDSPLTPSPPSFKSQRSSYAEPTTTSRNVSFDSITTYQTLPSYHSRRASASAFPPSAFPARPLPTLPNWS